MTGKRINALAYETPPQIALYIPKLLAGIWSMSIPVESVMELLQNEEHTRHIRSLLDLGCGKGAISISLAKHYGFKVRGIDIYAPYVDEARTRALKLGVDDICQFENDNIKKTVYGMADYDMVLLIWVGGVLGSVGESVEQIRRLVRPGGYMVIGEGCFKDGVQTDHAFQLRFASHAKTRNELTMHGDVILKELVIPPAEITSFYNDYIDSLRSGARECAGQHPEHAEILNEYVDNHEEMCRIMEDTVDSCLWLLQKPE